jgi:hypothetical protein
MTGEKFTLKCFLCSTEFQYSHGIYGGRHIREYDITVCNSCYSNNWDGWVGSNMERVIEHLKTKNLPIPKLNDKGWLPRGG